MRARELFSLAACLTIFVGGHVVSAKALRADAGDARDATTAAEHVDTRSTDTEQGFVPR
jgi:hypothetical protein